MKLQEILPRFSGVRRTSNGYIARCPSHEDARQSLAFAETDGRILLYCFAGCDPAKVVSSAGLCWSDLFDRAIQQPAGPTPLPPACSPPENGDNRPPERGIVAIYPYVDECGNLLYENIRYDPKDFRQRTFDRRGAPVYDLRGVRRVPYRLPELQRNAVPGSTVFMCEGEKDVDAVRELGLTATNLKNWSEEFNRYISDTEVVILTDHDLPGIKQAEKVARIVSKAARSVKIVDLLAEHPMPDKDGGDVSDWICVATKEEDLSAEDLAEMLYVAVENADEWKETPDPAEFFLIKPASQWLSEAKVTPVPKMLAGEFWFEGELCILFADTNVGKSIFAVQVADAISRGKNIESGSHLLAVETPPQRVCYFDFELTKKQLESRFAERVRDSEHYANHYDFHPHFLRAEINPDAAGIAGWACFEDYLNHQLAMAILESTAKVLIVDNLTYLRDETENSRSALPLMKYLKELKSKYGLSILTLAHTPKRDSLKPIGRNDLQGSKMLINFCDSSFAIGESQKQPGLRYLKQIKARNTEFIYHAENVLLASIRKEANFLGFHFHGTGTEREHLKGQTDKDREQLASRVRELSEAGLNGKDIAATLGISPATVSRYLRKASLEWPDSLTRSDIAEADADYEIREV